MSLARTNNFLFLTTSLVSLATILMTKLSILKGALNHRPFNKMKMLKR